MQFNTIKRLLWPTLTLLGLTLLVLLVPGWEDLLAGKGAEAKDLTVRVVFWVVGTAIGLSLAWLVVRLIDIVVWGLLEHRCQTPVPRLLKDMVTAGVFLIAGITIVGLVFKKDVTALWVSSGVVGLIVGFALRNMIADVFSGIALNVDRPFRIGDWIEIHARSVEPKLGCVTEISWRSTRIRTTDNTVVILPNSLISSIVVVNLTQPETRSRFELTFRLEFGIPTERGLRVLSAGARAAKGPLAEPAPKVLVDGVTEEGVVYKVRYWLEPKEVSPRRGRHQVTSSILQHLYQAGISLAYPKQDLYLARMPSRQLDRGRDRTEILKRIELFTELQPPELVELAGWTKERLLPADTVVVRQGESGSSMFVVVEGLLEVRARARAEEQEVKVVELQPGDFFGEMSLLTGAARSATVLAATEVVLYEIGYDEVNALLARRPELAGHLAEVAADRQAELTTAGERQAVATPEDRKTRADQILRRMKAFFTGLKEKLGVSFM